MSRFSSSQVGGVFLLKFLLIQLVISLASYPVFSQYFKDEFKSKIRDEYWAKEGHSNTVSNSYSISGKKSYKAYLPAQVYENARSEIRFRGGNGTPNWHPHFSTWGIKLAVYFPTNFTPDNTSSELIFQYHGVKDAGDTYTQNPWSMRLRGNNLSVTNRWIQKKIASDADQYEKTWNLPGNIVPGKWHYFVVDIHWDYRSNGNGFMQVYMKIGSPPSKSDLVINHKGPTGYNDDITSYFKMGIYKWDWKDPVRVTLSKNNGVTERVLYYDDFEIQEGGFLVGSTNQSPNANAGSDKTISLPSNQLTINGSATDPDGNLDTYEWAQISGPSNATMKKEHTLNLELSKLKEGTYLFRLTVEDTNGASDTDDVLVTVTPNVNQIPTADAGPTINITLPDDQITIEGSGTDSDGTIEEYSWSQISGPSDATLSGKNSPDLTASNMIKGTYVFRLTVTDNDGATHEDGVQVIVNPATHQAPNANAGPNKTITLPTNQATINGAGTDSDGSVDKFSWTQTSGPSNATLSGQNNADLKVTDLVQGTYVFRLTVTDNHGLTDSDGVQVTVKPSQNEAPTADAGSNKTITLPANKITINGAGTDSDGTIETYAWSQVSGPTNATMNGKNTSNLTADNLVEGTYLFKLTVTDDDGASDSDQARIVVNESEVANQSPVAKAGTNKNITLPDNTITINGSGTDTDGIIASYSWTQSSGPSTATLSDENTSSLSAEALIEGTYVFELLVTDNDGATDTDKMQVTVKAMVTGNSPIAEAGPNRTLILPKNSLVINGSGIDADGEITSYKWSQVSGPTGATLDNVTTAKLEIENLVVGVYEFELRVIDDMNNEDIDQIKITVFEALPAVTATINDAICTSKNGAISLSLTGGLGPFQFDWSNGTNTRDLSDLNADDYQVTITDQNGNTVSKLFTVINITSNLQVEANISNASCSGNNGAIEVTASGGLGPYSFEWSSQARTPGLDKLESGSYDLVVIDQNGCNKKFSFEVGVDPGESTFNVSSTLENATCAGSNGSISLATSGSQGPYSYVWSHGANGPELNNLEDGKYTVTITDRHGCYMKSEYTLNQDPGPAKPIITQAGDSLYVTQQATYYQWFKDSIAITEAHQRALKITTAGTYSVQIYNEDNCMSSSDYFNAKDPPPSAIGSNQTFALQQVDVYPIPAVKDINVRLQLNEPASTNIIIYDLQGRVIQTHDLGVVNSQVTENLSLDRYPSGTFLISIKANQEIVTRRFIKH